MRPIRERNATSSYRPDIDGLRAIAVVIVVGYHAFPEWVRGGFVGVDIFFVISGYLITGIIARHIEVGDFRISDFYRRRIRRIFPALLLVTSACLVAGWFLLSPHDYQSLGTNIAGGAVFIQNLVLLTQVGYFDIEAAKKPLLHLWSLGVEEQYYIVWPLVLMPCGRRRWNAFAITIVLLICSFGLGLIIYGKSHELAFYLPVTRAWELLIGSALSLSQTTPGATPALRWIVGRLRPAWPRDRTLPPLSSMPPLSWMRPLSWMCERPALAREICAAMALAAIAFAIVRFKPYAPFPGSAALFPTLAAAVLIATPGATINRRFLGSRPMTFVGLISYPLYLWHFPLMAFARIRSEGMVPGDELGAIIAISFGLAWATYRFVEHPFRRPAGSSWVSVGALVAGMATIGILGLIVATSQGVPSRIPKELRPFMISGEPTQKDWRVGRCMLLPEQGADSFSGCDGQGPSPHLFLWGDSFAAALYPGLEHFAPSQGYSVSRYASSACPPLVGFRWDLRPFCKSINDDVLKTIARDRPEIVILHCKWLQYDFEGHIEKGLDETIPKLKAIGVKRIVVLGAMPTWLGNGLPGNVLDYYYQTGALLPERTTYRSMDAATRSMDTRLKARAGSFGVAFISARDILCNDQGCLARIGDSGTELTAFDVGHLTTTGSIFLARTLSERLLNGQLN